MKQSEEEDDSILVEGSDAFERLLQASADEVRDDDGTSDAPTGENSEDVIPLLDALESQEDEPNSDQEIPQPPIQVGDH